MEPEEFFARLAITYGKPDLAAAVRCDRGPFERGIPAYLRYERRGIEFMYAIVCHGEAKVRGKMWYRRYARWWDESKCLRPS